MGEFHQIYVDQRILQALYASKREDESIQTLISRYLEDRLKLDFPGIFDVIDENIAAYEEARANNKMRVNKWRQTLKQLNVNEAH